MIQAIVKRQILGEKNAYVKSVFGFTDIDSWISREVVWNFRK
jgi:hypothetical protein